MWTLPDTSLGISFLPFPPHAHPPPGVSWDHVPNGPLALRTFSQALLVEKPKPRKQVSHLAAYMMGELSSWRF